MCIIIDSNVASNIFKDSPDVDHVPVLDWLFNIRKKGVMITGGRLSVELYRTGRVGRALKALNQAGRAITIGKYEINSEIRYLNVLNLNRSNDVHILAIARVSGARTICTRDHQLEIDFRNSQLIDNPRGSIYKYRSHAHLLRHTSSCGK